MHKQLYAILGSVYELIVDGFCEVDKANLIRRRSLILFRMGITDYFMADDETDPEVVEFRVIFEHVDIIDDVIGAIVVLANSKVLEDHLIGGQGSSFIG